MVKAKQIADQYNVLGSEMRSKTSALAKETESKKQAVLDTLEWVEDADKVKDLWHKAKVKLTSTFKEENKELIAEYKRLWAEHRKNETVFKELFAKAQEAWLTDLDEAAFKKAIIWKIEKKESKEMITKSLEFEKDTFKIESKGWKEEERDVYGKGKMKVKVNTTGDVIEYLEGEAKWEQIFITYGAVIREICIAKDCSKEEAEKKYLMTRDELEEKMKDKPSGSQKYIQFFKNEIKGHLAGYWNPSEKLFNNIGKQSSVWLAGASTANFNNQKRNLNNYFRNSGFSVRLLKN